MPTYQAETYLLGSILLESSLFKELKINQNYFVHEDHRKIYLAMDEAMRVGGDIDIVILTDILGKKIQFGDVGYLVKLADSVHTTTTFKHHEQMLIEHYQLQEAKIAADRFLLGPSVERMNHLVQHLTTLKDQRAETTEKSTYDALIEISEELITPQENALGCVTSLDSFDQMTGGLQAGDLIILAARPSVGKTAFALNLAAGHCKNGGTSLIFSLEMGTKQLLKRLISAEGKINASKWRDIHHRFTEENYTDAMKAIGEIANWEINISEAKHSLAEIRAAIRKSVTAQPEKKHLVIIDYLQLIAPALSRKDRRDLEIGEITRELKLLALELKIPIILLSQLSRGVDARNDKRPLLSDLRESGNIEQDADVVTFLYRDDYYDRKSGQKNEMEVIIAKQRNGPTGVVKLEFLREFGGVEERGSVS